MEFFNGFDVESGERIFVPGADNSAFTDDLVLTPEWIQLATSFDLEAETDGVVNGRQATGLDVVNLVLASILGPKLMSTVQAVLRKIIAANGITRFGDIVPVVEQAVAEEEVPVDRNGNPLSESQIRWSEYRQFAESHSSQECKDRAKFDAGFGSFLRKNLEREMNEVGVGDAVQNLNTRTKTIVPPTDDLKAWVAEYQCTPSEKVRSRRRPDSNPLGYQLYNRRMQEAIDAGLI